ncbi:MAG TPA: c-type cytochrome [Burkholderiales bacterium]|nr:c-type cytochrome [Burkholderiales bacterium]
MHLHRLLAYWGAAVFASATFAQGAPEPDVAKGQQLATQVCAACHAPDGNSVQPANPVLAGQHSEYTFKQLSNFKQQNGKPAERPNAIMAGMVANLTAEDMSSLAAYFQTQKPAPRAARDAELVKLGQAIYRGGILSRNVAACTACHGPGGAGVPAQFPRIAGQFAEYTAAQLRAFRAGERANDPNRMMRAVAERLSDREIAAVAEYISGLR